jgi:putative peptide zinc metalloprotease protein
MSAATAHARRIGARLREDLQVSHQKRGGIDRAVIKDPLALKFFEMAWDDYRLAKHMQAAATAAEIAAKWQRDLPDLCAGRDAAELEKRAGQLCLAVRRMGLAETHGTVAGGGTAALSWGEWLLRGARRLAAPMFVRMRLFDPDEMLDGLVVRWRPLFSAPVAFLAAVFVAATALAAVTCADELTFHVEWFFTWQNLAALYAGILLLKIIHESGHALVCKALGGHVHEVGAQLLAFHPTFFVDVSDTWLWPDRRRRIAVAAAGFCAELVAAAVLFWLWRLLSPGFARDLCLNLAFIASVSAVLFNANPLMRYDGYHLLADAVREPHLRKKSFATLSRVIRRFFFGRKLVPPVREKKRWLFGLYAILSSAFLVWIVFVVGAFLQRALAPYGLEVVGQVLIVAWLVSMAVPPLQFLGGIMRDIARVPMASRWRPLAVSAVLASGMVAALFVPVPVRIERECVLVVSAGGVVRASQPGTVAEIFVREGDRVKKGQPLVRLENRRLALSKTMAGLDVGVAKVSVLSAVGENRSENVGKGIRRFNEARASEEHATRRDAELQLVSPCDGVVITRQLERQLGRMVYPGSDVIAVAETARREGLLPLTEKEARRMTDGAAVAFRAKAFPGTEFTARISAAPLRVAGNEIPRALTALFGGEVTLDAAGNVFSSETSHVSRFTLVSDDARLRPGLTGRARISCGRMSIGQWLVEEALDLVHLDHRL